MKRTELGKELAKLRVDHDQSAKEMATALGTSVPTLNGYESGRRNPSNDFIDRMTAVYKGDYSRFKTDERREVKNIVNLAKYEAGVADFARAVLEGLIEKPMGFDLAKIRAGEQIIVTTTSGPGHSRDDAPLRVDPAAVTARPAQPLTPDVDGIMVLDETELDGIDLDELEDLG